MYSVIRAELSSRSKRGSFLDSARRKHFLTRQDCRNIGRKLKDFSRHRHKDDAVSVDRIVRELRMESPSPVLAYKPQGIRAHNLSLQDDTFFLVVMTEFQAEVFEEFSAKIICVDSTHKTNQYKHKLVTLMVADECRKGMLLYTYSFNWCCTFSGYPVAWLISNKEDEETLTVFFTKVKERCPAAVVKTLMSDDGNYYPISKLVC